jgi:GTP-binding protein HflX
MIEKPAVAAERAVIVHPDLGNRRQFTAEERLEEARGLAAAIDIVVADAVAMTVRVARPSTLLGSGQIAKLSAMLAVQSAALLIVDGPLTAIQQRNLETELQVKVIDRTGLILEIFGARAASAEGRLQVELAHLDYQAGRLVRSWTHLERQRGGFGFLGGPGETQIEADRRMIRDRMARLRREIEQLRKTRGLHRDRRQRAPWPVIAIVGYTNAGKSTLFNRLTGANVMAKDMLFATLDTTMREFPLPGFDKAILSDTVGFVSDLPTQLIAAFRATLEEVTSADLILHVRDIAHPASSAHRDDVIAILSDLGLGSDDREELPLIEIWNKTDLLDTSELADLIAADRHDVPVVALSAMTGEGVATLTEAITSLLSRQHVERSILCSNDEGRRIAWLHEHGQVLSVDYCDADTRLTVRMAAKDWGRFEALTDD